MCVFLAVGQSVGLESGSSGGTGDFGCRLCVSFFSCSAVSGGEGSNTGGTGGFGCRLCVCFFACGAISGAKEGRTTDGTGGLGNRLHVRQSLEANLWRDQGEEDRLRRKRQRK